MRIVFMGTPDFAAASLEQLVQDGFDVCAVYTRPDKPKGRGMALSVSPVKELALKLEIPVFQPQTMKTGEEAERIRSFAADAIAVVAYGMLLPDSVISATRCGAINLHGSVLPKYRGAAPIQWAVLNGDRVTGLSTFYLCSEMDAGDLIYTEETEIGEFETSGELFDRMKIQGAALLSRTLQDIDCGIAPRTPQNHSLATKVPRLDKSLSPIDWKKSPRQIVKQICGLQPWPVATMELQGALLKVFSAQYTDTETDAEPGTVVGAGAAGIEIACGGGKTLLITEVQAPGKKCMPAGDYLRGHPIRL
ncbi:MAG: methionyl-tRNA formyltransferase [Oscillospiraceae bacterium]|nr:methionyl-tRNA formyltransferase [Oscillospiraceae bacterium]